jgi:hypothetical protein
VPPPRIKGLSEKAAEEIAWLERRDPHLKPGQTGHALQVWRRFVRTNRHRSWVPPDGTGCGVWGCCFQPRHARKILYGVAHAMPPEHGRELRTILRKLDELLSG